MYKKLKKNKNDDKYQYRPSIQRIKWHQLRQPRKHPMNH